MATGPGPQQRFPSHIIGINFPPGGGLLYMRINQTFRGSYSSPSPLALADFVGSDVSWANFDMFNVPPAGKVDPATTLTKFVPITDPVTNDMIAKYLYWTAHPKVTVDTDKIVPGISTNVVDLARWTLIYDNMLTFRETGELFTMEGGLAEWRRIVTSEGHDPSLVKVGLFDNVLNPINIQDPTVMAFYQAGGWTFHVETGPDEHVADHNDVVTIIINVGKLRRDTAVDPTTKKKPDSVTFKIHFPATPLVPPSTNQAQYNWDIDGGAIYKTTQTPPNKGGPLDGERRTFPVKDIHREIFGHPGEFDDQYMVDDFEGFNVQTFGSNNPTNGDPFVEVTVTFQKGTEPARVEFNGGPGTGASGDG